MSSELSILLIDENVERANDVTNALEQSRYRVRHLASPSVALLKEVDAWQPDIIVIDIESPSRDMLESLHTMSAFAPKPVVMFSESEDEEMINLSVKSGVSAYVVGDPDSARIRPILDAAVARFNEYQRLKDELSQTKSELEARKLVDQAKRLLMDVKGISENEAFHSMRKTAMDSGQKMEDVARTVISMMKNMNF
jgi:two-component system, response regulator / RNA-binding antiterminator